MLKSVALFRASQRPVIKPSLNTRKRPPDGKARRGCLQSEVVGQHKSSSSGQRRPRDDCAEQVIEDPPAG